MAKRYREILKDLDDLEMLLDNPTIPGGIKRVNEIINDLLNTRPLSEIDLVDDDTREITKDLVVMSEDYTKFIANQDAQRNEFIAKLIVPIMEKTKEARDKIHDNSLGFNFEGTLFIEQIRDQIIINLKDNTKLREFVTSRNRGTEFIFVERLTTTSPDGEHVECSCIASYKCESVDEFRDSFLNCIRDIIKANDMKYFYLSRISITGGEMRIIGAINGTGMYADDTVLDPINYEEDVFAEIENPVKDNIKNIVRRLISTHQEKPSMDFLVNTVIEEVEGKATRTMVQEVIYEQLKEG